MKTEEITNSQDVIDSRDVIARIEELEEKEAAIASAKEALTDAEEAETERKQQAEDEFDAIEKSADPLTEDEQERFDSLSDALDSESDELTAAREAVTEAEDDFDSDERDELKQLRELAEEADGYASDWRHGEVLIRESYFEDYARETAEDMYGKELRDSVWPFSCIDWTEAAEQLQQDYSSVEFGGVTYYVR